MKYGLYLSSLCSLAVLVLAAPAENNAGRILSRSPNATGRRAVVPLDDLARVSKILSKEDSDLHEVAAKENTNDVSEVANKTRDAGVLSQSSAAGINCGATIVSGPRYLCSNSNLGAKDLPEPDDPVGNLLKGYNRLSGLQPRPFLARWFNNSAGASGSWWFPSDFGFVHDSAGSPLSKTVILKKGERVDRFGFPGGNFLAPLGTPFSARSLPPDRLNVVLPCFSYHVYEVLKDFKVRAGLIAPWFGQPGRGVQYQTSDELTGAGFLDGIGDRV